MLVFSGWAQDFSQAEKIYRQGRCKEAIDIGNQVIARSRYAPGQVREDRDAALSRWKQDLAQCANALPAEYKGQLERFEAEYAQIETYLPGAGKTDAACDLLRRVSLYVNEVKTALADCPCRKDFPEAEALARHAMALCPAPCKGVEMQLEDMLKNLLMMTSNLKMSAQFLKAKEVGVFRKRIQGYQKQLLMVKAQAESVSAGQEFCLGRTGSRNAAILVATSDNLARGLGYLDQTCEVLEILHRRASVTAGKNQAFRDSVNQFFSQVNGMVDQWLKTTMPGDSLQELSLRESSTSQQMHDMLFKLAKIDLKRSLYLLDRPAAQKKAEVARLTGLSFEPQFSPQEAAQMRALRDEVVKKLYYSIPWPLRFWEEQRQAAWIILGLGAILVVTLVILWVTVRKKRKRTEENMPGKNGLTL